ncbi:hypothetical protein BG74_00165 [Sodalis-like endosymbiont of Proechinophthirus fluctus]|nr:hypothetical protein BG74_00165 [Sodalis-like endosymbiont of Proechinophthirus fluctus]
MFAKSRNGDANPLPLFHVANLRMRMEDAVYKKVESPGFFRPIATYTISISDANATARGEGERERDVSQEISKQMIYGLGYLAGGGRDTGAKNDMVFRALTASGLRYFHNALWKYRYHLYRFFLIFVT